MSLKQSKHSRLEIHSVKETTNERSGRVGGGGGVERQAKVHRVGPS